jgi:methylase of polypeptide subunit release factors
MDEELKSLRIDRSRKRSEEPAKWATRWIIVGIALFVALGAGRFIYGRLNAGTEVDVVRVRAASSNGPAGGVILNATGYIVAAHKIQVASKVLGKVAWIGVDKGDKVKEGQIIVRLEDDEYRAQRLRAELANIPPRTHIVDAGTGAGVGAITAARVFPEAYVTLTDINPAATRFAAINWVANEFPFGGVMFKRGDGLQVVDDNRPIDCIIANPPYIADPSHRAYRDGGAMHGGAVSVQWAGEAARRLERGGAFLLYTGSAIVNGEDRLKAALFDALDGFEISYREIDPDVFGEELEREEYADVERIAVVGLVAIKR